MAKMATTREYETVIIETVVEKDIFTLTLNQDEINVLAAILIRIGGDTMDSPRRISDGIASAIMNHSTKDYTHFPMYTGQNSIYFQNVVV